MLIFNQKLKERKKYMDNKMKYEAKQSRDKRSSSDKDLPDLDENFEEKV